MTKFIRTAILLSFTLVILFAGMGTAHAGGWYYRPFQLPKPLHDTNSDTAQKAVINTMHQWIDGYGPKPDGLRVVASTNTIHVWARSDKRGYKWRVAKVPESVFTPNALTANLNAGTARFGAFLRSYDTKPGEKMDLQYFLRFDRIAGTSMTGGTWHYTHIKASGSNNFKAILEQFINSHGPSEASGIQGGLSRGKDFHLWVRADGSPCKWKLTAKGMPASGSYGLLNGAILQDVARRRLAPLGFNLQSALWYAEKISSPTCKT